MNLVEELVAAAGFLLATVLVVYLLKFLFAAGKRKAINDTCSKSGHYWTPMDFSEHAYFCTNCKEHMARGYECDNCLLKVHDVSCLRAISSKLLCKVNPTTYKKDLFNHHWIPGNLGADEFCLVCDELCGEGVGVQDFRCSWCTGVVHTKCKEKFNRKCDFGPLKRSVLPPYAIIARKPGNRNQRMAVVEEVCADDIQVKNWKPLLVIVNPKSGSGAGRELLRRFRAHLHPAQVIDVLKSNMASSLRWIDEHPEIDVRILIAGGDGTICSSLDKIDELTRRVPTAILPLGTGNDLSRVLNWGKKCDGGIDVVKLMEEIQEAEVLELDRWTIKIETPRKLPMRMPTHKTLSMTNYVSVGVDACVCLGMQNTRDSIPRAMSSRFINKFLFFTFGTKDVFERVCRGLNERIELFLDDQQIELPDIEGLIFLNIPYWGAGVTPWQSYNEEHPQKVNDEMVEVFAVKSSFHIAQMQVGLANPIRIGQAKKAKLVLKGPGPFPMQSDGEAWLQSSAEVFLEKKCTTKMLQKVSEPTSSGCGIKFF